MRTLAAMFVVGFALTVGCGKKQTSVMPVADTTPAVFNESGAPTVSYEIPGMDCEICCESTFASVDGFVECQFDKVNKIATVAIDEEKFDKQATLEMLQKDYADAKLSESAAQ